MAVHGFAPGLERIDAGAAGGQPAPVRQGERIVAEAERWLGTPYVHQASALGVGCDCLGLLRGVWRSVYGVEPETPPPYTRDWSEPTSNERLWRACRTHLTEAPSRAAPHPGDVLLFRMRANGPAKHVAIMAFDQTMVHAHMRRGVMRARLDQGWRSRLVARFEWPAAPA